MDVKAFDSWAKKVIRNRQIDYVRKQTRIRTKETSLEFEERGWVDDYFTTRIDFNGSPIDINEYIYQNISKLRDMRKRIILMYYFMGYGDESIGKMLNIPKSTIGYNRNKALKELKVYLGGNDADTGHD